MKSKDTIEWLEFIKIRNQEISQTTGNSIIKQQLDHSINALDEAIKAIIERDKITCNAVQVILQNAELRQLIEDLKYYAPKHALENVQAKLEEMKNTEDVG